MSEQYLGNCRFTWDGLLSRFSSCSKLRAGSFCSFGSNCPRAPSSRVSASFADRQSVIWKASARDHLACNSVCVLVGRHSFSRSKRRYATRLFADGGFSNEPGTVSLSVRCLLSASHTPLHLESENPKKHSKSTVILLRDCACTG
jgi:hypothetical protein